MERGGRGIFLTDSWSVFFLVCGESNSARPFTLFLSSSGGRKAAAAYRTRGRVVGSRVTFLYKVLREGWWRRVGGWLLLCGGRFCCFPEASAVGLRKARISGGGLEPRFLRLLPASTRCQQNLLPKPIVLTARVVYCFAHYEAVSPLTTVGGGRGGVVRDV